MPSVDKATGRVIALVVLLFLAAASLRGYLPAAQRAPRRQETESPATLTVMVILLAVSVGILAIAFVIRMRNRRAVPSSIRALAMRRGGGSERPSWRVLLIGLAVISVWLLITWLLMRLVGQHGFDSVVSVSGGHPDVSTTDAGPPPTGAPSRTKGQQPNSGGDILGYLKATAIGMLLLLIIAGTVVTTRIRRAEPKPSGLAGERLDPTVPTAEPESLARAAELGLAEIKDLSREPREAIIGCYATMERELAHVPDAAPQDFDTPTEVLARAVEHHALPADNAAQLVNLFAEARFSAHLMTERHREDAVRILRLVLAELRSLA